MDSALTSAIFSNLPKYAFGGNLSTNISIDVISDLKKDLALKPAFGRSLSPTPAKNNRFIWTPPQHPSVIGRRKLFSGFPHYKGPTRRRLVRDMQRKIEQFQGKNLTVFQHLFYIALPTFKHTQTYTHTGTCVHIYFLICYIQWLPIIVFKI